MYIILGHVLRMPPDKNPKIALTWAPESKREMGWPKETWRRTVGEERTRLGFRTCREAETAARDRTLGGGLFGPFLHDERQVEVDDDITDYKTKNSPTLQ